MPIDPSPAAIASIQPSATNSDIHAEKILILDFGSQYTQLIARRIREIGVYCEIHPWDVSETFVATFSANGVVLSGGPESTTQADAPFAPSNVFTLGVPVLGICYGMQTMAMQLGGMVQPGAQREFGHAKILPGNSANALIELGDEGSDVWMSHGDHVTQVPPGFAVSARSNAGLIAAMQNASGTLIGLQFHPEVTHTEAGDAILRRFVLNICGCAGLWQADNIIADSIQKIQAQVGHDQVLLGLSGGVDSSVVAALLDQAIGAQLTCIFVDTGLLRWQEGDEVMAIFAQQRHLKVIRVDASAQFFKALAGLADPEDKRRAIGKTFIDIFEAQAKHFGSARWLAQGTIYPDVIESAGSKNCKAHVIKSHHNVGGLPERMNMKLVEPLRELFKDEVRRVGLALGLPPAMVFRHPFPGPGLAVRMLGEIHPENVTLLQRADAIFIEELRRWNLYDKVSQAFAVFLPIKSVGVVGDARAYDWVIALRAVETIDFMTAHWARLPYDFLDHVSLRIVNEVRGISRVVYDISGKPPATIEWE